ILDIDRVKIFLDIIRCHFRNLFHDFLLRLLGKAHLLVLLAPLLAKAVERLPKIFLNLVFTS
ncbi:MAG TPA: hypothetical protein DDW22_06515, partial [Prevotellaceae bacterium]|nr:hypothetical protein [Prevotellaceae bacterium]